MSTTKDCPGCGRGHIKGKRVLFPMRDGRLEGLQAAFSMLKP